MDFRILGPVEAREGDQLLDIGGGKQRALLALLLLNAGQVVPADRLIEALWGDAPPANAPKGLQVYVSRLRKLLGSRLVTRGSGYVLELEPDELDRGRAEHLIADGRALLEEGDAVAAERAFGSALELFRGPPLADVAYEDFAQGDIRRLEELRLGALEDRADAQLALGRHAALIPELEPLVDEHPVRERLHGQLMLALYRSGRQADALEVYGRLQRALRGQLGLDPSRELQDLQAAILRQDAELGAGTKPGRGLHPGARRRGPILVLAGAVALLMGTAGLVLALSGGDPPAIRVAGDGVAVIDPASGRIARVASVSGSPGRLVAGDGVVWVGADEGRTLSALDTQTARIRSQTGLQRFPTDLAVDGDRLWVVDRTAGRVSRVDARYGETAASARVGKGEPGTFLIDRGAPNPWAVAARRGEAWLSDGSTRLVRVGGERARVLARPDVGRPITGLAFGGDSLWAISGPGASVMRIDPNRGKVRAQVRLVASSGTDLPYPVAIEHGLGSMWVLNANSATVTRIDVEQAGVVATVPVGLPHGPLRLAVGAGAVWVANADGTLARIDPETYDVRLTPVANSLVDVAVAGGRVWVSAVPGLGRVDMLATTEAQSAVKSLPPKTCSPLASAPGAAPRLLIAGDLPLTSGFRYLGAQMDAAIRFVLRQRRFKAGRFDVAYQVCDDSTVAGGVGDQLRCEENALAYARNRAVVGVIGPFSSGCAFSQIPITNHAGLAMLSPANTFVDLTRGHPHGLEKLYPSGKRTYARIVADDQVQAAANALLASRLSIERLFVLKLPDDYGNTIEAGVSFAARRLGIRIVGSEAWKIDGGDFSALVRRVRRARPDGIVLGGALISDEGVLIRQLRAALPRARLLATDGFVPTSRLVKLAGRAADGMTVTIAGTPPDALGPRGRAFVKALASALGAQPETYTVHAAQAAEVMLDAIARSDGTRAGVVRELFRTRVNDGILGDFSITPSGDTSARAIAVYRIDGGRQKLDRVLTPARDLLEARRP